MLANESFAGQIEIQAADCVSANLVRTRNAKWICLILRKTDYRGAVEGILRHFATYTP